MNTYKHRIYVDLNLRLIGAASRESISDMIQPEDLDHIQGLLESASANFDGDFIYISDDEYTYLKSRGYNIG